MPLRAFVACLALGAAQTPATELPTPLEPCVALRRDAERLACFDKAIAAMLRGEQSAEPLSAEDMFGASTEIVGAEPDGQRVKREELKRISATVTSLHHADDGMIVVELDNGQVWRQQDSSVRLMVGTGDKITIMRASLGTFRITDKTGRFARFRRVR